MESLFPINAEFELLKNYRTPFHQHWLFYLMVVMGCAAGLLVLFFVTFIIRDLFRSPRSALRLGTYLLFILACLILGCMLPLLLYSDTAYYFGTASATDAISPVIAYLPLLLCLLLPALIFATLRARKNGSSGSVRGAFFVSTILCSLSGCLFFYWGMLII